ncbi:sulfotransferase [Tropicimonas sediminicola]|uniref:Sulfotransferase family protein n=1 Tax=Tropicimonas sediminicola TaxID=1031541 RepID=A0A239IHQ9_9RHOB|nr:sulfotransferase [Tropicimonas sediminicola]SNS92952.1 Sulfotransferase family protein [Tropicimonas sediminicola]
MDGEDELRVKACTMRLFEDVASQEAPQRTFHIFGVNRGGTTAVAGVLSGLGIPLGTETGTNLEDRDFRLKRGLGAIVETVARRNEAFDVWGWKHPHSNGYIEDLLPHLRNVRFIVTTRDLGANALGMYARGDENAVMSLRASMKQTRRNLNFVLEHKRPTLIVSYEKLLLRTEQTVSEIARFCGVEMTADHMRKINEFVQPGRYKTD